MALIKCNDCGELFDEEDVVTRYETVGEFWGQPARGKFEACPNCGSDNLEEDLCRFCDHHTKYGCELEECDFTEA